MPSAHYTAKRRQTPIEQAYRRRIGVDVTDAGVVQFRCRTCKCLCADRGTLEAHQRFCAG